MPLYYHVYGILFNILEFMEEIKQNKMIRYYKYTGRLRNNMQIANSIYFVLLLWFRWDPRKITYVALKS